MNPANNGSIEFADYATLVGNALGRFGYVPANGDEADLVVELDYGVDEGQRTVRSTGMYGSMFYGGFYGRYYNPWYGFRSPYFYRGGFYRRSYLGGMYDPFGYYPIGMGPSYRTYTNYTRHLKMVIKPRGEGTQNLYEGQVTSTGRNNRLHEAMPYMVQAFFTNFPGVSGASERITIEIPES